MSISEQSARCRHCGNAIPRGVAAAPGFCCAGCEVVHALLVDGGLERYYELARDAVVPAPAPRARTHAWLDPLVAAAGNDAIASITLDVQGIHCAGCVWLLGELFRRRAGADGGITVNPALGKARLRYRPGRFDVAGWVDDVERFGYLIGPDRKRPDARSRELPVRLGICAALTVNVMLFSTSFYTGLASGPVYALFTHLTVVFSALVVLVGGWVFFRAAIQGLRRGVLHLDLPIAVAIALAFSASFAQAHLASGGGGARGYFDTLDVFVTVMLVGRWLQQRVLEKNRRFLLEDDGADGILVRRRAGDRLDVVHVHQIRAGDDLLVAPGDLVPVDALLVDERAEVSTDWITGEPMVQMHKKGAILAAGSFNAGRSTFAARARTDYADSPLPMLLRQTAPETETRVAPHVRFWRRYARAYVVAVLGVAAAALASWWRQDPHRAIDVTVAVLVVTCPCAIGLAAPLAYDLVEASLRRSGFFVRAGDLLDRLMQVHKILFDKTGTLALGRLELEDPAALAHLDGAARAALLDMAARSNHPVSRTVAAALERTGARASAAADVIDHPGRGLELRRDGRVWRLGRASFAGTDGPTPARLSTMNAPDRHAAAGASGTAPDATLAEARHPRDRSPETPAGCESPGDGATVFSCDRIILAALRTVEAPRPDARAEIAALHARGIDTWILSGDTGARVARFARSVGIDPERARGDLRPEDKAALVGALDRRDTLYLGDGINDSLAFERALCAGTPAIDRPVLPGKSAFFLLGEGLAPIGEALMRARQLARVLRCNLAITIAYNVVAVGACLLGWMTPLRAAIAMPTSSLAVLALTTWRLSPSGSSNLMRSHHDVAKRAARSLPVPPPHATQDDALAVRRPHPTVMTPAGADTSQRVPPARESLPGEA